MKSAKLIIKDEVNVKFEGLDPKTRSRLIKSVEYTLPYARYTPQGRLGRWSGKVSMMQMGGQTYFHLLDRMIPILEEENYHIDIEDNRVNNDFVFDAIDETYLSDVQFPIGHHMEGQSIILRKHQVEVVNACLSNRHGIAVACTSAGKTLICAALSRKIEKYGRSIIIVPSKDLVTQTEQDYKLIGLDCGVFYGERKELNRTHTICTWQSLNSLWNKTKADELKITDQDIHTFLSGVVCLIGDECHTLKADVLKALLGDVMAHIPLRWGLTGTIPKEEVEELTIRCNVGNVIIRVDAADLQELGILSTCHINVLQLESKLKFGNYHDELAWLTSDPNRLGYISSLIKSISESGNTLVLVDRISAGDAIISSLGLPKSSFVNGSVQKSKRSASYSTIQTEDNMILVATFGVASTGINIPRIFNLVIIEPGKSFVRTIQSIGRGLRKAKDKDSVMIYDICGTNKYSSKHVLERLRYYKEARYPYTRLKITDWQNYNNGENE